MSKLTIMSSSFQKYKLTKQVSQLLWERKWCSLREICCSCMKIVACVSNYGSVVCHSVGFNLYEHSNNSCFWLRTANNTQIRKKIPAKFCKTYSKDILERSIISHWQLTDIQNATVNSHSIKICLWTQRFRQRIIVTDGDDAKRRFRELLLFRKHTTVVIYTLTNKYKAALET